MKYYRDCKFMQCDVASPITEACKSTLSHTTTIPYNPWFRFQLRCLCLVTKQTLRVVGDVAPSHTTPGFLIIYRLIIKFSYLLWIYIFTRNAYFAKGVIAQWGYHNLASRKLVLLGAFDPIGDIELPTKLRPGEGPRSQILANLWFLQPHNTT